MTGQKDFSLVNNVREASGNGNLILLNISTQCDFLLCQNLIYMELENEHVSVLGRVRSYLTNGFQFVRLHDFSSSFRRVSFGIPQQYLSMKAEEME